MARRPAVPLLDRPLPEDQDAERGALGSVLLDPTRFERLAALLPDGEAEFANEKHRLVYRALEGMRGVPHFDTVLLRGHLGDAAFATMGGYEILGELLGSVGMPANLDAYARAVHDCYLRRLAINACYLGAAEAWDETTPTQDALANLERTVTAATARRAAWEQPTLIAHLAQLYADMDSGAQGIKTGLVALDAIYDGMRPGEVTIVGARPSCGKTALALTWADDMMTRLTPIPVGMFSLEMTSRALLARMAASRSHVSVSQWRRGNLSSLDRDNLRFARDSIAALPLTLDDRSELPIGQLRATAALWRRQYSIEVVFVDYLQLVKPDAGGSKNRQRYEELGEIARGLKALAKEQDIAVVALCQLNRAIERENRRPRMSDLRESGDIEASADNIILIHPLPVSETPVDATATGAHRDVGIIGAGPLQSVELIVAKQRQGPRGTAHCSFDRMRTQFVDGNQTS